MAFAAVLDTCVLWPSLQRDFVLSLAAEGLYRPLWSSAILDELEFHEADKLVRRGAGRVDAESRAARLVRVMNSAFDDALVSDWERVEGQFGLPDPDDEHVVAAAVMGGAGAIVTHNVRDFPAARIPVAIQVQAPDDFALCTVEVDPQRAAMAVAAIEARSGRAGPRLTARDVIGVLGDRYGMTETAAVLEVVVKQG